MLIPSEQHVPGREAHWKKTLKLIEGMQAGLRSGANEHMRLGRLEYMIGYFHQRLAEAMEGRLNT